MRNQGNSKLNKFASLSLVFWLLLIMDGFWCWILPSNFLIALAFMGIAGFSLLLYAKREIISVSNRKPFMLYYSLFLLLALLQTFMAGNILGIIFKIFTLFPLIFIAMWPSSVISDAYLIFRKFIILFAFGAICLSILTILGFADNLPFIEVQDTGRDYYVNQGTMFRVYGIGVLPVKIKTGILASILPRALGPFHEAGHFAIYLGLIVIIDRMAGLKLNPILLIAGLLTFSMAFILVFIIAEVMDIIVNKNSKLLPYTIAFIVGLGIFFLIPEDLRAGAKYMLFERNFEGVMDQMQGSGLESAADERANLAGIRAYDSFMSSKYVLLGSPPDHSTGGGVLSDYRGLIMNKGVIGFIVTVLSLLSLVLMVKSRYYIYCCGVLLLILLHRSWMYVDCYIQTIYFIGFVYVRYNINGKMSNTRLITDC